jgi:hypothetical protein
MPFLALFEMSLANLAKSSTAAADPAAKSFFLSFLPSALPSNDPSCFTICTLTRAAAAASVGFSNMEKKERTD